MTANLSIERRGPVGRITLNRPERHNAFDDSLIAELTEALRSICLLYTSDAADE